MQIAGVYDGATRFEEKAGIRQVAGWLERSPEQLWIDLTDPTAEELTFLRERFQLHPLAVEECDHTGVRPKIEEFETHLYMVFHGINHNPGQDMLEAVEFKIFLRKGQLITVHDQPSTSVAATYQRLRQNPAALQRTGVDTILHQVLDLVVDHYFPIVEALEDQVESLEERALREGGPGLMEEMLDAQRRLLTLNRRIYPQMDLLGALASGRFPEVEAHDLPYFRDVCDHLQRIHERVQLCREMVSGAMQAHLSQNSNRMNAAMKGLAVLATLTLPATFLTSLLGMNLDHLPGKRDASTFGVVTLASIALSAGIFAVLRRARWL